MKKLLCVIILLSWSAIEALPIGNPVSSELYTRGIWWAGGNCDPCDPCFSWCEAWSLRLGFYGDSVFHRHMETRSDKEIDTTKLYTNAGFLALNLCERVDIFSTLGATKISFRGNGAAFGFADEVRIFFRPKFSWSLGARAALWNCHCLGVGIEGQYFRTEPDFDRIVSMTDAETVYIYHRSASYREWQAGIACSYDLATCCPTIGFVPYVGLKWSCAKLDMGSVVASFTAEDLAMENLETKKHLGYAAGATLTLCESVGITVEGRFADEKAVHVNAEMRF